MQLVRSGELKNTVVGLQYKDKVAPGLAFLTQYGNPYTLVLRDPEGQTGINFGVYGVPETFIIDKKGHHPSQGDRADDAEGMDERREAAPRETGG